MKNITLRQIRIFLSISKYLSFTRAAEDIHITVPAISLQIKEMESNLGINLFNRSNKKIELTAGGEYFLLYARRVIGTLNEADIMMERLRGSHSGILKIGLVSTAEFFLPLMLAEFKKEFPTIRICLEVRNRQQLGELLHDGEIDVAIMGQPPKEIDTRIEAFADHPHAFIASPANPLAFEADIDPQRLNQFEMITREPGSGTKVIMQNYLIEHGISALISMEISSNEGIKQAVATNLGISLVSLHTIRDEVKSGKITILNVQHTPILRTWHVVALKKRNSSQAAEAFRYFMLEKGSEIISQMFNAQILEIDT
jgi:LysR family transcriptional regulator, low CO2-responsive transcriptional regulator